MEEQISTPITTATSAEDGRLIVGVVSPRKKKRNIVRSMVKKYNRKVEKVAKK